MDLWFYGHPFLISKVPKHSNLDRFLDLISSTLKGGNPVLRLFEASDGAEVTDLSQVADGQAYVAGMSRGKCNHYLLHNTTVHHHDPALERYTDVVHRPSRNGGRRTSRQCPLDVCKLVSVYADVRFTVVVLMTSRIERQVQEV